MASPSSDSYVKKEYLTMDLRKRPFECLFDQEREFKVRRKDADEDLGEFQNVPTFSHDELRRSIKVKQECQVLLDQKEESFQQDLQLERRFKEKDATIINLEKRVKELESSITDHEKNRMDDSSSVKNLLLQITRLQGENDSLRSEVKRVKHLERSWASKYWKLHELQVEKDKISSRLEHENAEKDSLIQRLQDENHHMQRRKSHKGDMTKAEQTLIKKIETLRGEFVDKQEEFLHEKINQFEFMAKHKPVIMVENPEKTVSDLFIDNLNEQICGVKRAFMTLKNQVKDIPTTTQSMMMSAGLQIQCAIQETNDTYNELIPRYKREIELRKKYHNELVELRGNIRVLCRIRPPIQSHHEANSGDSRPCVSVDSFDDCVIKVNNKGRCQDFEVDKIFTENVTQCQVFDEVSSLVTSVLDGFNVCMFAYGQTGSGKTYTMEGPSNDPGINQRALRLLFEKAQGSSWTYTIEASVLEVYNETVRDLLNSDPSVKLEVKMKPEGGLHVPGLASVPVTSLQEANQIFCQGRRNRATGATNQNVHSSRSHCLLCITVKGVNTLTGGKCFGRLNLVDLAGSERLSKSFAEGSRLKEAQNINKSLSSLGDVINALKNKHNHIPYRNSKLTYLLQDSLGGDSKTLMILHVSPEEINTSETVCTLGFGQRARAVELGAASKRTEGGGKGTPSQRRGGDNSVKTTPTVTLSTGRPQNLAKSCTVFKGF